MVWLWLLINFLCYQHGVGRPNILLILVDDLGYGDLSVPPFNAHGIRTPELEKFAKISTVMTNFHVAAPICTPSRASILTGLFPWRHGIYSIYGTGPQSDEHLHVIPNAALVFQDAGYHTGKWHLGGLTPQDIETRKNQRKDRLTSGDVNKPCTAVPGPNQHGFKEYVAMQEGRGSRRLTHMLPKSCLYHEGAKYLIRNDDPHTASSEILTIRQTTEAIRIMTETLASGKNFYMHMWYDAPHSPWETIEPFDKQYSQKASQWDVKNMKYASMVSSVDQQIGRLVQAVRDLGIEQNTLIVFLSDNGPENQAGSAGPFQGRKRSLHEGGIRVPCMWHWPGTLPENRYMDDFAVATDLLPTFMEAAGVAVNNVTAGLKLDGISLLSMLKGTGTETGTGAAVKTEDRVITWYKDMEGVESAAWAHSFKLFQSGQDPPLLYDMRLDKLETKSIFQKAIHSLTNTHAMSSAPAAATPLSNSSHHRNEPQHVRKIYHQLFDKMTTFVKHGHLPHSKHQETVLCASNPTVASVTPFQWSGTLSSPEH